MLKALSANALNTVHEVAIGVVELMADQFHLREAIEDFDVRMEELRLIPGLVMTDNRLRSAGEPQRVFITHPKPD